MLPSRFRNLPPRRVDQLIAAGLFLLALAIRLIGIGWGLPNDLHNQSYHPDEPINYAVSREVSPAKLDFAPGFYNYGTLYFTVLRVAGDMALAYGSPGDDPWKQAAAGHMAGRIVSALAGAGTVLFVFLMLRLILWGPSGVSPPPTPSPRTTHRGEGASGRFGAVFGALLIAFAPAHVVHSRFQTPDVFATFLIAVSLYFSLRIVYSGAHGDGSQTPGDGSQNPGNDRQNPGEDRQNPGDDCQGSVRGGSVWRMALWAGTFAGLAAGTKYTGALALLPLLLALLRSSAPGAPNPNDQPSAIKAALIGMAAAIVAFILSTPGVLTDTAQFMKDFTYELGHSATGHGLVFVGYGNGFAFHFTNLILGVGLLLTILGLVGLIWGAISGSRRVALPGVPDAGTNQPAATGSADVSEDAEKNQPAATGDGGWAWIALAFFVPYFILIGRAEIFFMRYTFPLYLGLALGFGWLMDLANHRKRNWLLVVVLGIIGLFGVDFGGLRQTATLTYWMASEDPRDSAARYLKEKANKYARQPRATFKPDILVVGLPSDPWFYTPPLYPNTSLPRSIPAATRDELRRMSIPRVAFVPFTAEDRSPWNIKLLTEVKPDYVAYSSFEYADVSRLQGVPGLPPDVQIHVDRAKAFADRLKQDYILDRIFGKQEVLVHDMEYIRPNIWVWKRKSSMTP